MNVENLIRGEIDKVMSGDKKKGKTFIGNIEKYGGDSFSLPFPTIQSL